MSDKLLITFGAASALLTLFTIVFAIKVLSKPPTPIEVAVLLSAVFVSSMAVIYTSLKFLGRKPPL